MAVEALYFLVDATHPDFVLAQEEALTSQETRNPGSVMGLQFNQDKTKAYVKVIGDDDWYPNVAWYGHPMILGVYSSWDNRYASVDELRTIISQPEWTWQEAENDYPPE